MKGYKIERLDDRVEVVIERDDGMRYRFYAPNGSDVAQVVIPAPSNLLLVDLVRVAEVVIRSLVDALVESDAKRQQAEHDLDIAMCNTIDPDGDR